MADQVNPYVGAARAALGQGLGMGWGDEAEAWLRAKAGQGSYEDNLRRIRQEYAQYAKEYPFTQGALEFAGGAAPGVAAMFIPGGQAAGAAQLQRSTLGALGRLAAAGAATGAISGAGSAEEGQRLGGAGTGAVMGGALGVALPLGMRAGKGLTTWGRERFFPTTTTVESGARRKMLGALQEGDITPQDLQTLVAADRARFGVPSVVANVNPALADLAEAVAQRTGKGARRIEKVLGEQKAGARDRAYGQVAKGLKPGDYFEDEQRMVNSLRSRANTEYQAAYNVGEVNDPKIMRILEVPEVKAAFETARKIAGADASLAKIRGEDPSRFDLRNIYRAVGDEAGNVVDMELRQVPDVRTLDYMKRALDAQITAGFMSDNAATKATANTLKEIRNELRDALKTAVPEYDQALKNYGGDIEVINAMRSGLKDFGRLKHEEVARMVAGMSDAEKDAFRTGVARNLYDQVMKPSNSINAAKKIIGSPATQDKLRPLFASDAEFDLFKAAMLKEAELYTTANKVLGGSQTAKRQQMREALEEGSFVGDAVAQAVTGGFWNSLTGATARLFRTGQLSEKTAERMAQMLTAGTPEEVAAVVAALEKQAAEAAPKAVRASAKEAGAVTGTTSAIYPAPGVEQAPREMGTSDLEADIAAEEAQKGEGLSELEKDIQAEIEAEKKKEKP